MVAEPFTAPEQSGGTIVLAEAVSGASGPEMVMVTLVSHPFASRTRTG